MDKNIKILTLVLCIFSIYLVPVSAGEDIPKGFQRLSDVSLFDSTNLIPRHIVENAIVPEGFYNSLESKINISNISLSIKRERSQSSHISLRSIYDTLPTESIRISFVLGQINLFDIMSGPEKCDAIDFIVNNWKEISAVVAYNLCWVEDLGLIISQRNIIYDYLPTVTEELDIPFIVICDGLDKTNVKIYNMVTKDLPSNLTKSSEIDIWD